MSNYSNFDLRKFLAEGKKADKESMEEQEEVALSEELTESTDLLQLIQNVDPATVGAVVGILGSIPAVMLSKLGVDKWCSNNPDNMVCKKLGEFGQDFSAAEKTGRASRGYEEGVEEELNEEPVSIAAVAAGVAAIFGGSIGLTKLIDKAEAGDFGPKGEKLAKHLRDMGAAAGQAIHGDGDHHPFEGVEGEEELNEDPVSIPFVAAGLAAIFGGSIGLDKLMDKAEAGEFGPKGEKLAAHLRKYGKQAGDATQHRGFEEGAESEDMDESVIAGVAALIGSSFAAAKVLDWIQKNYPEAVEKFLKYSDAAIKGSGKTGTEKGGMMFEKEDEEKKDKMDEAKFKEQIKSILES